MRARIVIPIVLVGVLALLLPFLFQPGHARARARNQSDAAGTAGPQPTQPAAHPAAAAPQISQFAPAPAANSADPESDYQNYEASRIADLEDLGSSDDPNALAVIESEFDNRDPRIQEAAVDAAIQFGSRDAIPALQQAYWHLDDPAQKLKIQEAIHFLELPTQSEAAHSAAGAGDGGDGS